MQSDSIPTLENTPAPSAPKSNRLITAFIVALILAALGLGYWTFTQSTALKSAEGALAAWQKKYESLASENDKLTNEFGATTKELANTNAELENTQASLTKARAELSEANKEKSVLAQKMDNATGYLDIMRGAFEDDDSYFFTYLRVAATGDSKFIGFWNQYQDTGDDQDFLIWITYLFTTAVDILEN